MATRTNQEQLQKFDEIVEYFAQDPSRRTDLRANGLDRNFIELDGRRDMCSMLLTTAEATFINDYIGGIGIRDHTTAEMAMEIHKRYSAEWGQPLSLVFGYLHDDDRCWTAQGLSDFGHDAVDVYRHLFVAGCIDDGKFKKAAVKALNSQKGSGLTSMCDQMLAYARALVMAHPVTTEDHELGTAG